MQILPALVTADFKHLNNAALVPALTCDALKNFCGLLPTFFSTNDRIAYGSGHYLSACSCYGAGMEEREFLVKAQEAEAFANAADDPERRRVWEYIAREFRRLAGMTRQLRKGVLPSDFL